MSPKFAFTPLPVAGTQTHRHSTLAGLIGSWRGEMVDQLGKRESFTLLRDETGNAVVAGRFLFFVSHDVAPTGVRLLEAAGTSFVALVGPYYDPREKAQMITVIEGSRNGDQFEGRFYTRVYGWRQTVRSGTVRATRSSAVHKAA